MIDMLDLSGKASFLHKKTYDPIYNESLSKKSV
jgi:hypothetical protein